MESRNDTVLVKYAYLSDGMKASTLNTAGAGLVYRGSMSFRKDSVGILSALDPYLANATLSYTDFGARHYSPTLRRWLVPDPLSEKYYDVSPYAYCAGDPVNLVDVGGDSLAVLKTEGQHLALIIQGEDKKWYFKFRK